MPLDEDNSHYKILPLQKNSIFRFVYQILIIPLHLMKNKIVKIFHIENQDLKVINFPLIENPLNQTDSFYQKRVNLLATIF